VTLQDFNPECNDLEDDFEQHFGPEDLAEILADMRSEFAPREKVPQSRDVWSLLHRVREAEVRRKRQVQARDVAILEAMSAGCSCSIVAKAAGMTPQGLRKRLNRLDS
jgi:hypothetical protein